LDVAQRFAQRRLRVSLTLVQKARMWPQKHRSGNTTGKVQVGRKQDGKPDIRSFPTEESASQFRQEWNGKLVAKNAQGLADLSNLARTELLAALAKLDANGATITEAVDFFIKYAKPVNGKISTQEAVTLFLEAKTKLGPGKAQRRETSETKDSISES
jgi:hypothetical protein